MLGFVRDIIIEEKLILAFCNYYFKYCKFSLKGQIKIIPLKKKGHTRKHFVHWPFDFTGLDVMKTAYKHALKINVHLHLF